MPKTKNYTSLEILDKINDNPNSIFEINKFGNEKVIEWINKDAEISEKQNYLKQVITKNSSLKI